MPAEDREDWTLCRKDGLEREECTEVHTFDGEYRHAKTYEDAERAISLGDTVRDFDGDEVINVEINEFGERRYIYIDTDRDQRETVGTDHPSDLLIIEVDVTPVTDAEMAEVIASLASVTTTQQHNV